MKIIKIQRILNKTDLGISGKHGSEILLNKSVEKYFSDINMDEPIAFIDMKTNSSIHLTLKNDASVKLTGRSLKKYFNSKNIEEGDIIELIIKEDCTLKKSYYLNTLYSNNLIFKRNQKNNLYYSLSESKLFKYVQSESQNFIQKNINIKLRNDAKYFTQHYKIPCSYNLFSIDMSSKKIKELVSMYTIIEEPEENLNTNKKYLTIEASFKPKARLLLQLGDQLIKNEKIALSEIIKNSYDACSKNVKVIMNDIDNIELGEIIIYDDGFGMDIDIIKNVWMEPGTNYKENKDDNNLHTICNRRPIGEKGIGRFGVHKLGNHIELISKKEGREEVIFKIDWNDFESTDYLSEKFIILQERKASFFTNQETGTYIRITKLRKEWNKRDFRELYRSAFSLTSPFETKNDFYIDIETNLKNWKEGLLSLERVKQYGLWYFECTASTEGNNQSKIIDFKYKFQPYLYMDKAKERELSQDDDFIKINPFIKREIAKDKQKKNQDKFEFISFDGIGKITLKGYIFDFDKDTLDLSDLTDRKGLRDFVKQNGGVRVYRDNMRIYDYGEVGNDWLNMDADKINATSKIANRNILSSIYLKGKDSKGLIEKTNREGFIENSTYNNFRDIIINIINKVNFLKNEDKDKFRKLYAKEKDSTKDTLAIIEKTKDKVSKYITDDNKKEEVVTLIEKIEVNYNSLKDVVLKSSGTGLAYSLVMHEVEKMVDNLKNIVVVKKEFESIQELVLHLSKSIESISSLLNNDKVNNISLTKLTIKAIVFFRRRLKKHHIELVIKFDDKKDIFTKCLNNLTVNAIMNLIDNSAYWLKYNYKELESKKILVDIIEKEKSIELIIADTGFGFSISDDTAKLPFKTTKDEGLGKGLGLYFVNEIMNQNSGTLKIITNKDYKRNTLKLPTEFIDGATVALEFIKVTK